jgi:hypothetical protein
MEKEKISDREKRRWAAAQRVLGGYIKEFETTEAKNEDYESAAQWRDLNFQLQNSETPVSHISIKPKKK